MGKTFQYFFAGFLVGLVVVLFSKQADVTRKILAGEPVGQLFQHH